MTTQVVLTLSDLVYARAQQVVDLTGWTLEMAVETMLEVSLPIIYPQIDFDRPVTALSDEEVLALATMQMTPSYERRYSELLDFQQAGEIAVDEREELNRLQRVYEIGMLYKSEAQAVARQRGLHAKLN